MKELPEAANKPRRVPCSSWRADNCFLIYLTLPSTPGVFLWVRFSFCKSSCGVPKQGSEPSEHQPQEPCSLPWDQLGSLGQLPTHIRERSRSLQNPVQHQAAHTPPPPAGSRGWQCSYSGRVNGRGAPRKGWSGGRGRGWGVLGGVRHSAPSLRAPCGAPGSPCSDSPAPLCDFYPSPQHPPRTLPGVPPLLLGQRSPLPHPALLPRSVPGPPAAAFGPRPAAVGTPPAPGR